MKLRRTGLRSLWDLPMPQSSQGGRGEEVPPGTSRLYFFWPPCQPRLNVYTSSSSLLLLHCCLSASIPQGMGEGGVEGMGGVEKSWRGKDKKKRETDKVTACEGEGEGGKEGVASSSPGIKSQWTLPDLWHNKHIIFLGCPAFHWVLYWYPLIFILARWHNR